MKKTKYEPAELEITMTLMPDIVTASVYDENVDDDGWT